jgi:hypothetical protein
MRALIEAPEFAMLTICGGILAAARSGCACRFGALFDDELAIVQNTTASSSRPRDFRRDAQISSDQHRRCSASHVVSNAPTVSILHHHCGNG